MEILSFIILGLISAIAGSILGLGGGFIITPLLIMFFGYDDPKVIAFTSLSAVLLISLLSTTRFIKMKRINFKIGFLYGLSSVPGAIIGANLSQNISSSNFKIFLGIIFLIVAVLQFLKSVKMNNKNLKTIENVEVKENSNESNDFISKKNIIIGSIACFGIALISSLLGIGGGTFLVPMFIGIFKIAPHKATATSQMIMFFMASFAVATHLLSWSSNSSINIIYLAIGIIPGVLIGTTISQKIKPLWLVRIFSIVLFFLGLKMML